MDAPQPFRSATDVLKFLNRFSYKPGYKLQFWKVDDGFPRMEQYITFNMVVPVPDSTKPDQPLINIAYTSKYSTYNFIQGGPDYAIHALRDFLMGWEKHELDEWYRIDGEMLSDPHAGDRR